MGIVERWDRDTGNAGYVQSPPVLRGPSLADIRVIWLAPLFLFTLVIFMNECSARYLLINFNYNKVLPEHENKTNF